MKLISDNDEGFCYHGAVQMKKIKMFCCHFSKSGTTQNRIATYEMMTVELSGGTSVLLRPFSSSIHSGIGFGDDRPLCGSTGG